MKTEDIIYRVNRGYTMSIYGSSQAIHEEMLKDITFLLENNKQLILSGVSHQRELLIDFCTKLELKAKQYSYLIPDEDFIDEYLKDN